MHAACQRRVRPSTSCPARLMWPRLLGAFQVFLQFCRAIGALLSAQWSSCRICMSYKTDASIAITRGRPAFFRK